MRCAKQLLAFNYGEMCTVLNLIKFDQDIDVSVGTSPITPCYDVEQLETKTHVGFGPGESIEYTKHRVRLEGHPWPGCCPEETPGCPYSYGQTKQKEA